MSVKDSNIERLICALHHKKADRVPNFEIWMGSRILSHLLGYKTEDNLWTIDPQEAVKAVMAVGQDAIPCPLHFLIPQASVLSHEDMDRVIIPDPKSARAKLLEYMEAVKDTQVGVGICMSGPLTPSYMTCGPTAIESFMYLIYDEPELCERVMDMYVNYYIRVINEVEDIPFDFFYIGDDISGTKGSLFSPDMLERYWAPRAEKLVKAAKGTGRPVMFHCCGDQTPILPYLVKWGVNAAHPLQANANDIYKVYEKYGKKLTLVGNIDVSELLSFGTIEDVKRDVHEHLERLSGEGGYIACSSHSIIDSIPCENYLAIVETVHAYEIRIS